MDQKLSDKLKSLGLTANEAAVYTALVELGGAYPSKIAEETHIHRTTVYHTLDALIIKGLANSVKRDKKQFYQAEGASALHRFTKSRMTIASRANKSAEQLGPLVDSLLRMASHKPSVEFYEGRDGVMQVYHDHLNVSKPYEMIGFSNVATVEQFLGKRFLRKYVQTKIERRISSRGIFPDTKTDAAYLKKYYAAASKHLRPLVRTIPAVDFPYGSEITMYGTDKVSILNIHDKQLIGVILQDVTIHQMMRMIFELAWKGAK